MSKQNRSTRDEPLFTSMHELENEPITLDEYLSRSGTVNRYPEVLATLRAFRWGKRQTPTWLAWQALENGVHKAVHLAICAEPRRVA